jgi:hypothetical protein
MDLSHNDPKTGRFVKGNPGNPNARGTPSSGRHVKAVEEAERLNRSLRVVEKPGDEGTHVGTALWLELLGYSLGRKVEMLPGTMTVTLGAPITYDQVEVPNRIRAITASMRRLFGRERESIDLTVNGDVKIMATLAARGYGNAADIVTQLGGLPVLEARVVDQAAPTKPAESVKLNRPAKTSKPKPRGKAAR